MSLEDFFFTEHPALIKYECVSITHPNFSQDFNLVRNSAIGLKVEADPPENYIEYTYVPMEVKTLGSGHDMDQSMEFTIGDVGELLPAEIERISAANGFQTKPTIVYREYASNSTDIVVGDTVFDGWVFDGIDDEISMGDVTSFNRTDDFSVFAFYKNTGVSQTILAKQSAANQVGWRFVISSDPDEDFIMAGPGASQQIQAGRTSRPPTDGAWHQFGFTYDGSSDANGLSFYIDSVFGSSTLGTNNLTSDNTTNSEPLQIGRRGTSAEFNGTLKHISIWNRALTSGEVAEIYGGGTPPDLNSVSCASALVGWWKLDGDDTTGSGGVVDHSSSGFDGTAAGGLEPTYTGGTNTVVHTGPVFGPFTLEINSIAFNKTGCTFTAKATAFNRARTGEVYDAARFPMLRAFV